MVISRNTHVLLQWARGQRLHHSRAACLIVSGLKVQYQEMYSGMTWQSPRGAAGMHGIFILVSGQLLILQTVECVISGWDAFGWEVNRLDVFGKVVRMILAVLWLKELLDGVYHWFLFQWQLHQGSWFEGTTGMEKIEARVDVWNSGMQNSVHMCISLGSGPLLLILKGISCSEEGKYHSMRAAKSL